MTRQALFCSLIFLMTALLLSPASAQEVFEDPDGQFNVALPTGWIAVVSQDSLGRNDVNIVFKIRENGLLKVRRGEGFNENSTAMDFAKKDEGDTVRFLPNYDKLSLENFILGEGRSGALLAFDYKNASGQLFTGRNYYLRIDEKTFYVLRFTGRRNILGSLRNQTDSIARSFKPKSAVK